jgi:O-acetyl-ADP-ribose deacetylase (regulator of RNase III)
MNIKYVIGDATRPIGEGEKLILHIVNDKNKWGAGFVLSLSKRWDAPEKVYRAEKNYVLGNVQIVQVEDDITVINMIAQHGLRSVNIYSNPIDMNISTSIPPIRYDALKTCLEKVNKYAIQTGATIHAPRFGAGLSGGNWNIIEQIIKETLTVDVTIYDLK